MTNNPTSDFDFWSDPIPIPAPEPGPVQIVASPPAAITAAEIANFQSFWTSNLTDTFVEGSSFFLSSKRKKPLPRHIKYQAKDTVKTWEYVDLELLPNEIRAATCRPGYSSYDMKVRFLYRFGGGEPVFDSKSAKAIAGFSNESLVCEILPGQQKVINRLIQIKTLRHPHPMELSSHPDLTPESWIAMLSWKDFVHLDPPLFNPYKDPDWI